MNAHQRRTARRAKNREPWVMFAPVTDWMRELSAGRVGDDAPAGLLLTGEIGTFYGVGYATRPVAR